MAIRNEEFWQGRLFALDPDGPMDQAPYTPWRVVRAAAAGCGIDLFTADQLVSEGIEPREAVLIAYDWTPTSARLLHAGARPGVLLSLEPPVIAWQLYLNLPRLTRQFPHTFLFEGARERVARQSVFHSLQFPQVRGQLSDVTNRWQERRFLVMMSANKGVVRSFRRWFDKPRAVSIKRELATLFYPPIGYELYTERLRAIAHFSRRADFDLYGPGWECRHPAVDEACHRAAQRVFRGTVSEKLAALRRYKFSMCFENSRFPGYVSEKLFDCFFSGCIPVYYGAPDIDRNVPVEAYIDLRQFRGYAELERFLETLSAQEARAYLEAATDFVHSAAFQKFSAKQFAEEIISALESIG